MGNIGRWLRVGFGLVILVLAGLLIEQISAQASDPPVTTGRWAIFNNSTPNYPGDAPVVSMVMDSRERLWVGTDGDGVAMYDGFTWTPFNVSNTGGGLLNDHVYFVKPFSAVIWIGGPDGVSVYNSVTNQWFKFTMDQGLPTNEIRDVVAGSGPDFGKHYFGTGGLGVVICNIDLFTMTLISCPESETQLNGKLHNDFVFEMGGTSEHRWVLTAAGAVRVVHPFGSPDPEQRTFYEFGTEGCPDIYLGNSMAVDFAHDRVWFTLSSRVFAAGDPGPGVGACVFDLNTGEWRTFNTGNSGLGDNSVVDVAIDSEGRAWFGALGDHPGVYVYSWATDTCCWQTYTTSTPGAQLAENNVRTVATSLDRVYFGHLNSLTGFALYWQAFNRPLTALASLPGQLWVGTPTELLTFDGVNFTTVLPSVDVRDILALSSDNVWAATGTGLHHWNGSTWQQFTTSNSGISSNNLNAVAQDNLDRIWVGTATNGISVFDSTSNAWATFDTSNVLPSNNIRDLTGNEAGDVWVASAGGVSHFDGFSWNTYTTADGIPSNNVTAVAIDTLDHVWAGTVNGPVMRVFGNWTTASGTFPTRQIISAHAPAAGGIWFGVAGGALYYDGANWLRFAAANSGLSHELIRAVTGDSTSAMWFGGLNYAGGPGTIPGGLFVRSVDPEPLGDEVPGITSFTPISGTAGVTVTITGTGFQPGGKVFFGVNGILGGVQAQVISSTNTSIAVVLPSQAIKGKLRVTNGAGAGESAEEFLPVPVITSIDPSSGPKGAPIKIMGTNLASLGFSEVKFGASVYSSLIISSTTHNLIEAIVPADATDGPVMVKTSSGEATGPNFTLGTGGLKLLDWEVHQGLPQYQHLVAGKSTVVRLFLGSDAPGGCSYVTAATLQILKPQGGGNVNFAQLLSQGGIPNQGWFCGLTKQVAAGGSIDFVIPGDVLGTGMHNLAVAFDARMVPLMQKVLGNYPFAPTDDLRVHITAPGNQYWDDPAVYGPMNQQQKGSFIFNRQILNFNRIYPVRDGVGGPYTESGLRYFLNPFSIICNGIDEGFCNQADSSYNLLYDFWQENRAGILRQCMIPTYFPVKVVDDGSSLAFPFNFNAKDFKRFEFVSLVRPGQSLPPDPKTLFHVNLSSPDLEIVTQEAITKLAGPSGCPEITYNDIVLFRVRVRNNSDSAINNATVVVDYNEGVLNTAANGGLVLGMGNTIATYRVPGQFFFPDGAQGAMFDPPMDFNYNGVIDEEDLALVHLEFDNWDPATGEFVLSNDFSQLSPKDVARNFLDLNGNKLADPSDTWGPYLERHRSTVRYAIYDVPRAYRDAFNEQGSVDLQFSQLWFWNKANPFDLMGLGGQTINGVSMWADMDSNTAIVHESGHSVGLDHSQNSNIPGVAAGYNVVEHRVVLGDKLWSVMADPVTGPIEDVFLNPLQHNTVFNFFRNQFGDSAVSAAAVNAGPVIHLAGTISKAGDVEVSTSYRSDQLPVTPVDVAGSYWLRLADDEGFLANYRFDVPFEVADLPEGEAQPDVAPFDITQPWVEGTKFIEIWDSSKRIFQLAVSASAPSVTVQSPNGGENVAADGMLTIKWSGNDADGDPLTYAVYYSADGGTTWNILSPATNATQLDVPAVDLPGSANALMEVHVSDGVNTASDRSNAAFQVANKAPRSATIAAPNPGEQLVQTQLQTLVGTGYDLEDGQLAGDRLAWHSDQLGALGSGESVTVNLPVGIHLLTLVVTDSANLTASSSITVEVLADFDRDGLADTYEEQYGELAWWNPDDAGADPDGDGLTSRSEAAWGTDPGEADSDGDGVSDGDEATAGSLPTDANSKPQPARVLASAEKLEFAMAAGGANPASTQLLLMSSTPTDTDIEWTANLQGSWLKLDVATGQTPTEVTVSVAGNGLAAGEYQGQITFQGGATPWTIPVTLIVADPTPPVEAPQQLRIPLVERH